MSRVSQVSGGRQPLSSTPYHYANLSPVRDSRVLAGIVIPYSLHLLYTFEAEEGASHVARSFYSSLRAKFGIYFALYWVGFWVWGWNTRLRALSNDLVSRDDTTLIPQHLPITLSFLFTNIGLKSSVFFHEELRVRCFGNESSSFNVSLGRVSFNFPFGSPHFLASYIYSCRSVF